MRITEPTTMITDYILGVVTLALAASLHSRGRASGVRSVRWWSVALGSTGIAALTGGTYHGFALVLPPMILVVLWKVTMYAIGAASASMITGVAVASLDRPLRGGLIALAILKFAVYAVWIARHDDFRYAVYDYVPAIFAVFIFQFLIIFTGRQERRSAYWIIAGVLVSVGAAVIQQSHFGLHPNFNHNDLYHVIQIGGIYCLYRGARELRDRGRETAGSGRPLR